MCSTVKLTMGVYGASMWPFDSTSDTGGSEGWWSAQLSSTHHVSRSSSVRQQSHLQGYIAVDIVQPLCEYSGVARCGPIELLLQILLQKAASGTAELFFWNYL
ncbi:uncharacterized protein LOC130960670 [Arachis stenosperma]|uniref:uncharacterized protein LOC130960670 n=1 Tax=Arachis stenosperma TaxID=217475 RepID=UPI0025AD3828|nr:uncharacterized protein LOC130960670 [Arachis stenosperma]